MKLIEIQAAAEGGADVVPFATMHPRLEQAWRLSCQGRVEAALDLAQQVHDAAQAADDQWLRSSAASHLGWYRFMLASYEEGIVYVLSARDFWAAVGDRARESWTRAIHAWLLIEIGSPSEALDEAMLALELAEAAAEDRAICFALNVAGVVYWMLGQLEHAQEFAERSVAMARTIGDGVDLGRWLINLAGIEAAFWDQENAGDDLRPDEPERLHRRMRCAVAHVDEARRLAFEAGDSWAYRLASYNLTEYHLCLGERDQASKVLQDAGNLHGGDGARSRIYYLFSLGKLQIADQALEAAIETLSECATLAAAVSDMEIGVPCCQHLAEAYNALGRFAEALQWHKEFHARYTRRSTEASVIRSRLAAIQYETRQLHARMEAERLRADELEQMNRVLAQEATLLMNVSLEDALTGLPNRRGLERALLEIADEGDHAYAFAMMDIDNFKRVNDTFSHALGDDVLRQVGVLLRAVTRDADLLFRYGGEEFALLMSTVDTLLAAKICRRVRQAVRGWNWAQIHPDLQITLSIGLAMAEEAKTPAEVMAIADERLYRAKNAGRDRIVMDGRMNMRRATSSTSLLH